MLPYYRTSAAWESGLQHGEYVLKLKKEKKNNQLEVDEFLPNLTITFSSCGGELPSKCMYHENQNNATLCILRHNFKHRSESCRKTAYLVPVRSIFEHSFIVRHPHFQKKIY